MSHINSTINICLFSHGQFIKKNVLSSRDKSLKILNTSVHLKEYVYSDKK